MYGKPIEKIYQCDSLLTTKSKRFILHVAKNLSDWYFLLFSYNTKTVMTEEFCCIFWERICIFTSHSRKILRINVGTKLIRRELLFQCLKWIPNWSWLSQQRFLFLVPTPTVSTSPTSPPRHGLRCGVRGRLLCVLWGIKGLVTKKCNFNFNAALLL